jgi:hypothetical protein
MITLDIHKGTSLKRESKERNYLFPLANTVAVNPGLTAPGANFTVREIVKSGSYHVKNSETHYFLKVSIQGRENWLAKGVVGFSVEKIEQHTTMSECSVRGV